MQNLVLREEDFRTERMVVMEERRLRTEDNPQAYVQEQIEAAAFQIQPYHWPTIGWMEDIARFTLEDLKSYYRTYYNPINAFLVVVGDFKKEDLLPRIEKAFGSYPKGAMPNQERDKDPPQNGERRIFVKKEAQLPYIVMGYHVPNLRKPDSYVLEVIEVILSGGKSSRLYQSLVREKRLVLSADADHSLLSRDPSLFYLSADLLPGKDVTEVEKALDQEVERLQREPVGERELEKAKNQLEAPSYLDRIRSSTRPCSWPSTRSLSIGALSMIIFLLFEKSQPRISSGWRNNTSFRTTGLSGSSSLFHQRRECLCLLSLQ